MGMNVGPQGAAGPQPIVDINTTPLIDVMLVLLIMLIVTIPIQLHAVKLNMPVGTPPADLPKPEVVKLDIDARSTVYWNGLPLAIGSELEDAMREASARAEQPQVHLRPDRGASYGVVASVMSAAQRIGLTKIAIVGSEQFVQ